MMMSPLVLQNHFQPTDYAIELDIDHLKSNFNGQITIALERDSKPVPETKDFKFILNSAELVLLSAVFIDGEEEHKAKVTYNGQDETAELIVNEGHQLYSSHQLKLKIKYLGKINTIKTYRDFTKGVFKTNYLDDRQNNSTNYILATHSQASFARFIYPSIDEPNCKTTFQLSISALETFTIISNSLPTSREITSSKQLVKFDKTPPMNTSIFGFILGDLELIESSVNLSQGIIPVRFFTPIGQISKAAYPHDVASKLLPKVEKLFDSPYPLPKLDIVALPFLTDGAMENFGLITIQSTHILLESLGNREQLQNTRQLIAHELIHHWIGNNISFDDWSHLWLNEAFATWFAYYVLDQAKLDELDQQIWDKIGDVELEKLLDLDAQQGVQPIITKTSAGPVKSTQDAFQVNSYNKGIQFLRMLGNVFEGHEFNDKLDSFTTTLSKFVQNNQYKTIKPMDLWKALHDASGLDLLAFSHSWLRTPGFPILDVSINKDGFVEVEQHRFFEDGNSQEDEDIPYHVPLAIKLVDGSVINKIMNDRRTVLNEIKSSEFLKLNTNRVGIYRVHYKDESFFDNLIKNFNQLTNLDLFGIVHDLNKTIGDGNLQTDLDIVGFLKITQIAMENFKPHQFPILSHLLNNLEVLENSYKIHSSKDQHDIFHNWILSLNAKLFEKLEWKDIDYRKLSKQELETRKSILSIGLETPQIVKIHDYFFKKVQHGPRQSVPEEFLVPVFQSTSLKANQSTWKKVLSLVKSPGATTSNVINGSDVDIQNAAIRSIGFTRDPALVKRVLNFVTTNIDSNLVELALVGLLYNRDMNKHGLWDWFKLNYDHWVGRSLRPGSQYSANLLKTVKNITYIVFNGLNSKEDKALLDSFVKEKLKLPEHGLQESVDLVKDSQQEKAVIAQSSESVVSFVKSH